MAYQDIDSTSPGFKFFDPTDPNDPQVKAAMEYTRQTEREDNKRMMSSMSQMYDAAFERGRLSAKRQIGLNPVLSFIFGAAVAITIQYLIG